MRTQHPILRRTAFERWLFGATVLLVSIDGALAGEPASKVGKNSRGSTSTESRAVAQPTDAMNTTTMAGQYCAAIRDAAAEARYAYQTAQLEKLNKELDERMTKLAAASTELRSWLAKRDAYANQASAQLVNIFGAMRPDAASEKLSKLELTIAAAILGKLEARSASAILNEMPADKAAALTTILAEVSNRPGSGGKR